METQHTSKETQHTYKMQHAYRGSMSMQRTSLCGHNIRFSMEVQFLQHTSVLMKVFICLKKLL